MALETPLDKKILKDWIDRIIKMEDYFTVRTIMIELIYKARGFDK